MRSTVSCKLLTFRSDGVGCVFGDFGERNEADGVGDDIDLDRLDGVEGCEPYSDCDHPSVPSLFDSLLQAEGKSEQHKPLLDKKVTSNPDKIQI